MAKEFYLPDIGEGLAEAVILSWYVDVGEWVDLDEPLVEIETDKAVVDLPSPFAGFVLHHGGPQDATIEVGTLLAVVGTEGEVWDTSGRRRPAARGSESAPIIGTLDDPARNVVGSGSVQALPAVRKLARDLGVDLAAVRGTGPGDRVTADDVHAAGAAGRPVARSPLSPLRRAISENLTRSWREIPHVTTFGQAAAEPLLEARAAFGKPPLEALLISRLCPLLAESPAFNSAIERETDVVERGYYDIGFAVDTSDGLLVAVIRDADRLSVEDLGAEVGRLSIAAKERGLLPSELRGQTFTISNIGAVGGRYGTPIIPHGTAAILSIGRADPSPVVRDGELGVGREFPLSLSYAHRLVDGATGRRFMAAVISAFERPT